MTDPLGEKRWTAMLAVDMVDFTPTLQRIGEEKTYALLQHVLTVAKDQVAAHGGQVIDVAGDGLLAAFGAPRALENASLEACKAAWAYHQQIDVSRDALTRQFGVTPQFRIGIAGGNVMVVQTGHDGVKVVGDSVNLAARLQAIAQAGDIVMSEDILRETDGFVRTVDQGLHRIKGYRVAVPVHRLDGFAVIRSRFEGAAQNDQIAFVSREVELAQMVAIMSDRDHPRISAIVGPAGIGKSRLLFEIVGQLADRPVFVGQCAPTGQSGFGPIRDIVRQASPADTGAPFATVLTALHAAQPELCDPDIIARAVAPTDEAIDALTRVLQERDALLAILRGLFRLNDTVFVIEDVHWIDSATQDLIALLADDPVQMIVTCRATHVPAWIDPDGPATLNLLPLAQADICVIVEGGFDQPISASLADEIATKSEGNPLIAVEIARALRQGDALKDGPDGLVLKGARHDYLTGNLQQLVLSRVDRLPVDQKAMLQVAAAIGRDFPTDILTVATGLPDCAAYLTDMAGLVEPVSGGGWRFAHALIRDAVYAGLLSGPKADMHRRIADAIENNNGDLADNAGQLAYHFTNANLPVKAVRYLIKSAQVLAGNYAVEEADQTLEQAMQMIETDPDVISDAALGEMAATWFQVLDISVKHARSRDVAARILPRLERAGYTPDLGKARTSYAMALTHLRDYDTALHLSKTTLEDAQKIDDALGAAWAKVTLMRIYEETYSEPIETVERLAAEVEPVAIATGDRFLAMTAMYLLSSIYRSTGRRVKALEVADAIAEAAQTQNDRRAQAYARWSRALVYTVEGNPEATYRAVSASLREAIPRTADYYASTCIELFAHSFMYPAPQVRERLIPIRESVRELGDYNLIHSLDWIEVVLAVRNGNLAHGWRLLDALIDDVNAKGNINLIRQTYILRSEILMEIAGLINLENEAPRDRPTYPKEKPGLADIILFLRLKLTAKRRATADLQHYIDIHPVQAGSHYARARIGLGLIAAANGDQGAAATLLREGHAIAQDEGLDVLVKRAEMGLARLIRQGRWPLR